MLRNEIKDAIYNLLVGDQDNPTLVDRECLWAKENRPKSNKSFIMLDLSPERGLGDDKKDLLNPSKQRISGIKECTLSLNAYGLGSNDILQTLWQKLQTDSVLNRCFAQGIAFLEASAVNDLTELIDARKYFERAQLDLRISYVRETQDPVEIINKITIAGAAINAQQEQPQAKPDFEVGFGK